MKNKETLENCLMVIAVIVFVVMIKISMGDNNQKPGLGKHDVDSVHALVVDSINKLHEEYEIQEDLDTELDADGKEFCEYYAQNLSTDSIQKLVIIASPGQGNQLHWHIRVKH